MVRAVAAFILSVCLCAVARGQSFSLTGSLNTARSNAGAVRLNSGQVLIVGGLADSTATAALDSSELYDPASGTFQSSGNLIAARSSPSLALLGNGDVLVVGGGVTSAEIFDPATGSFSAAPAMPELLDQAQAVSLPDGDALVTGVSDGCQTTLQNCTSPVELYHHQSGQFQTLGTLQVARSLFSAALLASGNLLVVGGSDANSESTSPLSSAEVFHPATGASVLVAGTQSYPVWNSIALLLQNGQALLFGGTAHNGPITTTELYDPPTDSFLPTGVLPESPLAAAAVVLDDGTVLVAGFNSTDAFIYNSALGTFSPTGALNLARSYATATLLSNGQVLVAGGSDNPQAELYTPAAPAPDFSLQATPLILTVSTGTTGTFQISANATSGFNSSITLGCASTNSTPLAETCAFQPGNIIPSATSTLTISGLPTAQGGEVDFNLTGAAGSLSHALELRVALSPPGAALAPMTLSFGNQQAGTTSQSQNVALSNGGSVTLNISSIATAGDFTQTSTCGATLAAGSSCTITVAFAPSAAGPLNGSLTITDDAPFSPQTVSLAGTGTPAPAPAVQFSPTSLTFGSQNEGTTSAPQTVTLTNSGNAALTLTAASASGDFAETSTCGASLAAGKSCAFAVTFTPTASGARSGALTLSDNAPDSPQSVPLAGTGAAAPAPGIQFSPTSLNFGSQNVGTSSGPQTVTLTNPGTAALNVTGAATSGAFAETTTCGMILTASQSCTFAITFSPTTAGPATGALTITDNAAASPQTVALSGAGVAVAVAPPSTPAVQLAPASLSFGNEDMGSASPVQTVMLTNTGTAALALSDIEITGANPGDFSQTNTCGSLPSSLAAGANCTLSIIFTPSATGSRAAAVIITDNASDSPETVPLTGTGGPTGSEVTLQPAPNATTSATVAAGQAATYSLMLAANGSFSGPVALACAGAPTGAVCTISPATLTASATATPFTVAVTTAAAAAAITPPPLSRRPPWEIPLALLLLAALPLAYGIRHRAPSRRFRRVTAIAALEFALSAALAACGGSPMTASPSPTSSATPAGTYTLTVNAAAAGAPAGAVQLTLTVQ